MAATRRLAAIVAADVAGYSRLMGIDEEGTHERLKAHRRQLVEPKIGQHHGRTVKNTGDGMLVEFPSVVDAVRCAAEIQRAMADRDVDLPEDRQIKFRVGINLGDVIVDEDDIFGDGVNVAARLEALAEPGGICISRVVRDQIRDKLPYAFSDMRERSVKNIARPVRAYALGAAAVAALPATAVTADPSSSVTPATIRWLSIVVLPFANLSNDPEQEYFVDGITDDLTTDLSRIADSFVISRNTAFRYKGKPIDVSQIGRELGVRYVLEGSVRRTGDQVRVNVQLIDAESGAHLWADRFDTSRVDLDQAQDEITSRLARTLNLELMEAAGRRIEQEKTVNPDARDLVMRGYAVWYRPRSVRNNEEAERIFVRALAIDPRSIDAKIGIAKILVSNVTQAWSRSAAEDTRRAERLLLDVLEQDTGSSLAHSTMGMVRRFQNRLTESRFEFETAIALDPNDTYAHIQLGWVLLYLGDPVAAVVRCEKAIQLSPHDPQLWGYHLPLGWCRLLCDNVDPAVDQLIRSRSLNPRLWHIPFALAAAQGLCGACEDAKTALAEMLKLKPEANSLAQYRALRPWGQSPILGAIRENGGGGPAPRRLAGRIRVAAGSTRSSQRRDLR
ncbi:MAG TPA: adenylate/guanylate cyclase domain-containing protein [Stellaceae bacterium]